MGAMKFHHCIKGMTRQKFQRNEDFEIGKFFLLYNIDHHVIILRFMLNVLN